LEYRQCPGYGRRFQRIRAGYKRGKESSSSPYFPEYAQVTPYALQRLVELSRDQDPAVMQAATRLLRAYYDQKYRGPIHDFAYILSQRTDIVSACEDDLERYNRDVLLDQISSLGSPESIAAAMALGIHKEVAALDRLQINWQIPIHWCVRS